MTQLSPRNIYVQAHRGYSELYPENTMLAMSKAFDAGVDQVEIDLGLTSDEHLVVIHDSTVNRTTNGEGPVTSFSLCELKTLDAGAWKGSRFAGERIPTLEEALELANSRGGHLCIEIKSRGRDPAIISEICKRLPLHLENYAMKDHILISSFDLAPLLAVRELDSELALMLIDWDAPSHGGLEKAIKHELCAWSPKPAYADLTRIERAAEAGLGVQIDVDDLPQALAWAAVGASGFSANDPVELMSYLRENGLLVG